VTPRRYGGSLVVWALLLAYASLYPFFPMRPPTAEIVAAAFAFPRYFIRSDIAFNVVAYVPLGILACLHFRVGGADRRAVWKAIGLGAAFSATMEALQLFVPNRVSSLLDVFSNTLGAALGAAAFLPPVYSRITRRLGRAREALVIPGSWGDAGLVLVMLWLLAQLNPALPFFGAGDVGGEANAALAFAHGGAVTMAVCGFGLFVSCLLQPEHGTLRVTLVLLSIALWLKFAFAPLLLHPHINADWMNEWRALGLAAGIGALAMLRRAPRFTRAYVGFVLILAGALIAKIFGAYSATEELVRLFKWPYMQVSGFASLTRFLHELWPVAAVVFLVGLFLRERYLAAAQAASEA
jgi:VanZ family protein